MGKSGVGEGFFLCRMSVAEGKEEGNEYVRKQSVKGEKERM